MKIVVNITTLLVSEGLQKELQIYWYGHIVYWYHLYEIHPFMFCTDVILLTVTGVIPAASSWRWGRFWTGHQRVTGPHKDDRDRTECEEDVQPESDPELSRCEITLNINCPCCPSVKKMTTVHFQNRMSPHNSGRFPQLLLSLFYFINSHTSCFLSLWNIVAAAHKSLILEPEWSWKVHALCHTVLLFGSVEPHISILCEECRSIRHFMH